MVQHVVIQIFKDWQILEKTRNVTVYLTYEIIYLTYEIVYMP